MSLIGRAANQLHGKVAGKITHREAEEAATRIVEKRPEVILHFGFTESEWNVIRFALFNLMETGGDE